MGGHHHEDTIRLPSITDTLFVKRTHIYVYAKTYQHSGMSVDILGERQKSSELGLATGKPFQARPVWKRKKVGQTWSLDELQRGQALSMARLLNPHGCHAFEPCYGCSFGCSTGMVLVRREWLGCCGEELCTWAISAGGTRLSFRLYLISMFRSLQLTSLHLFCLADQRDCIHRHRI